MDPYPVYEANVRDAATGEVIDELVGSPVMIVDRATLTPHPIYDGASDPIPGSLVTVTSRWTTPTYYIDADTEDIYTVLLDWYDPVSGARGPVNFEPALRAEARGAREAAEAAAGSAQALSAGVVRSVNGVVPDENGAVTVAGGGAGAGILILPPLPAPPPIGTPAGTVIGRTESAPPVGDMEVIEDTATSATSASTDQVSLPLPSGIGDGDLLVAVLTHQVTSSTWTAPTGWSLLQAVDPSDSNFRGTYLFWAVGTAVAGAQAFTNNTAGRAAGVLFRVVGVDTTDPILANGEPSTRPDNTATVPELPGSHGGLILSVTTGQQGAADDDPHPLTYSNGLEAFVSLRSAAGGSGSRTFLDVAWTIADGDVAEHTVTTAGEEITAMGSQVVALRGAV